MNSCEYAGNVEVSQSSALADQDCRQDGGALSQRVNQLLGQELSFIYNGEFESLSEAAVNEQADQPENFVAACDPSPLKSQPRALNRMNLSRQPRLTPVGEVALFRQYNFLKYRANALRSSLDPEAPDDALVQRIDLLVQQAEEAREQLVTANLRLAISIARRFSEPRTPIEELISEANLVLINAVEKFDYSRGFRFSTYATHAIQRHLYRYMARRQRKRTFEQSADNSFLRDLLTTEPPQEEHDESAVLKLVMQGIDELLNSRERFILLERFGLGPSKQARTLQCLSREMGISKERVRQLHHQAIGKIQQRLADL